MSRKIYKNTERVSVGEWESFSLGLGCSKLAMCLVYIEYKSINMIIIITRSVCPAGNSICHANDQPGMRVYVIILRFVKRVATPHKLFALMYSFLCVHNRGYVGGCVDVSVCKRGSVSASVSVSVCWLGLHPHEASSAWRYATLKMRVLIGLSDVRCGYVLKHIQ